MKTSNNILSLGLFYFLFFCFFGLMFNKRVFFCRILSFWKLNLLFLKILIFFFIIKKLTLFSTQEGSKELHFFLFFFLFIILKFCFSRSNFLYFFFFLELRLIPIVILILGWGKNPERPLASSYLFLYTFLGSIPLLFSIFIFWFNNFSLNFYLNWYIKLNNVLLKYDKIYFFLLLLCVLNFLIKLPIFGLHKWLPKAHVEASTLGSIILASILLKLGVIGLIKLNFFLNLNFLFKWKLLKFWILRGFLICRVFCLTINDFKVLIAYSSVVHMSFIFLIYYLKKKWDFLED